MKENIVIPASEVPAQRDDLVKHLLRQTNRIPAADRWHQKRAEWMIERSQIQKYLAPRIPWNDPNDRRKGVREGMEGVQIVCIGAGKGYEVDEIDQMLPRSEIHAVDPHDDFSPPVKKRVEKLAHHAEYLSKDNRAEHMQDLPDGSMDGAAFYFSLHHMDQRHLVAVINEMKRALKPDGYAFVIEDLVDSDKEREWVDKVDRRLNPEVGKEPPHHYKSRAEWEAFFQEQGLRVIDFKEEKPKDVRHGFFVLQRIEQGK